MQVLTALTRKFALDPDVSLPALAERCSLRFSGADFYALCADALMRAIRDQAAALPPPSLAEASLGRDDEDEDEDEGEDDGGAGAPEAPAPKVVVAARHFAQALETLTPSVSVEEAARYQRIQESFLQPERAVQNGHS